jgi:thioredoxin-like negative regulator of GroEL
MSKVSGSGPRPTARAVWILLGAACVVALALPAAAGAGPDDTAIAWTDDVAGAFRAARETRRPVVVDVWAVWCAPCRHMEETTYRDPRVVERFAGVVALKVDADADTVFVERYHAADALPTTLFLDHEGREIGRHIGAVDGPTLAAALAHLVDGYGGYLDDVDRGRDVEAVRRVAAFRGFHGNHAGAVEDLRRARALARKAQAGPVALDDLDLALARALRGAGDLGAAASTLKRVADGSSDPATRGRALEALVEVESERGRDEASARARERLRREFPDRTRAAGVATDPGPGSRPPR